LASKQKEMPEVILKGNTGTPKSERKGGMIIVSKDIKDAVLEERHPQKRIKGKSAPGAATFTTEEVKAKVTAAELKKGEHMAKLSSSYMDQLKAKAASDQTKANQHFKDMEEAAAKAASEQTKALEAKFAKNTKVMKSVAVASKALVKQVKKKTKKDANVMVNSMNKILSQGRQNLNVIKEAREARENPPPPPVEIRKRKAKAKAAPATPAPATPAPATPAPPTPPRPPTPAEKGRRSMTPARRR
jgi:hypothetical protein